MTPQRRPTRRQMLLGCPPDRARRLWTEGIDTPEPARGATPVEPTFTRVGTAATLVTLPHGSGESSDGPERARTEHQSGWELKLAAVADLLPEDPPGDLWFVLAHTAGPATPPGGVFSSPDFPLHIAFLRSLLDQGVLVAGGPLPDEPGAGMTVVHVPDLATGRRVVDAAQLEDGAVRAGLLDVRIRPWQVVMAG